MVDLCNERRKKRLWGALGALVFFFFFCFINNEITGKRNKKSFGTFRLPLEVFFYA